MAERVSVVHVADQHILLIPPTGLLEVIHTDKQVDVEATLRARDGDGHYTSLVVEIDTDYKFTVDWMVNALGPVNERARRAFAMLAGVHVVFTGPVMFTDVHPDRVYQVVAELSRKE